MSKELIIMLIITINKRARYNYEIIETYEAGLALTGSEIKSIRNNDVSINEAFVIIRKKEAFIINMVIAQYKFSTAYVPDADRTRKLLLHKSEIKKILQRIKLERLTMVPLKLYLKNNYAKLEIALVRGKKNYDKREPLTW
ncbi:SsrA-binding protein SmpB [Spiroplasma poulsonii]|uniref:SsrA-binding protein SmpB n=1 Tax=Spiroplasma poulsonii TaxID=2138 RepID=UPI0038D46846